MALDIIATENDIGGSGKGRDLREESWRKTVGYQGINHVLAGSIPASSADLVFTLSSNCEFIIAGHHIKTDTLTVTCTASVVNYIWLKFTKTSNLITGVALEARTTNDLPSATVPREYVKLCEATCSGSAITSTEDRRPQSPNRAIGKFTGNGSSMTIITGFKVRHLIIMERPSGSTTTDKLHEYYEADTEVHIEWAESADTIDVETGTASLAVNGGFAFNTTNLSTYRYVAEP